MTEQEAIEIASVMHQLANHIETTARASAAPAGSPLQTFLSTLRRLGFQPRHVVDVGAHRGGWTREALRFFPDAHFTLVEPQAALRADMEDLLAANPRVQLHTCGAGSSTGEMRFTHAERDDSSTFTLSAEEAQRRGLQQVVLPVVTIDDLVARSGLPAPEVIKIDAEGLDLDVLEGAAGSLRSCEVLLMEASIMAGGLRNDLRSVIDRAAEHGFRPFDFTDLNRTQKHGALWLVEVALIRVGGAIEASVDSYA